MIFIGLTLLINRSGMQSDSKITGKNTAKTVKSAVGVNESTVIALSDGLFKKNAILSISIAFA